MAMACAKKKAELVGAGTHPSKGWFRVWGFTVEGLGFRDLGLCRDGLLGSFQRVSFIGMYRV